MIPDFNSFEQMIKVVKKIGLPYFLIISMLGGISGWYMADFRYQGEINTLNERLRQKDDKNLELKDAVVAYQKRLKGVQLLPEEITYAKMSHMELKQYALKIAKELRELVKTHEFRESQLREKYWYSRNSVFGKPGDISSDSSDKAISAKMDSLWADEMATRDSLQMLIRDEYSTKFESECVLLFQELNNRLPKTYKQRLEKIYKEYQMIGITDSYLISNIAFQLEFLAKGLPNIDY